ncbi:ArfGap-domain-containing protein [Auriculariales sp. MPI-PUGE-AT-0066]|nr:ArfGap-domain-containing protein [Auriculariales sp. MPI-PUGE-AT-0066]
MSDCKQEVVDFQKGDSKNKLCVDCGNPNPQWASVTFAVFFCLQCAGTHRGFGVHISFVRSVTMDSWQAEQARRMKLGGNEPFITFMESYSAEDGGYRASMSLADKYTCWAAKQYREKLDFAMEGKDWTQSAPPVRSATPDIASAQATGLRKSRAGTRQATLGRSGSASPAPSQGSFPGTPNPEDAAERKATNETFFAGLGQQNAMRSAELPPSQGGRYVGFGSTPSSPPPSQHPAFGLSSAAAPTLGEFQDNPVAALGKGWSIFSAAVMGASKAVNDSIIQPGLQRAADPTVMSSVKGYAAEASKQAASLGKNANDWGKTTWGVDVAGQATDIFDGVKRATVGQQPPQGYSSIHDHDEETSALYHDETDDDFFARHDGTTQTATTAGSTSYSATSYSDNPTASSTSGSGAGKKKDEWEDW